MQKVLMKLHEGTQLSVGELKLWDQQDVAVEAGVAQGLLQFISIKGITIGHGIYLAPGAKFGHRAEYGCIGPAIGFAFKLLQQVFNRCTNTLIFIALNKSKQFVFGFGQQCGIIAKQPIPGSTEKFGNILFNVVDTA